MKSIVPILALAASALTAEAEARSRNYILYVLPQTAVSAVVTQRIARCPADADAQAKGSAFETAFDYKVALQGRLVPQRLVQVDVESGFLVDRQTKLGFAEDGYLKNFNGSATGQGGQVLVSLIKAGATIAAMAVGPAGLPAAGLSTFVARVATDRKGGGGPMVRRWFVVCRPQVVKDLVLLSEREAQIEKLEAQIADGGTSETISDLLARRRSQAEEIRSGLTIESGLKKALMPKIDGEGTRSGFRAKLDPIDRTIWFEVAEGLVPASQALSRGYDSAPDLAKAIAELTADEPGLHGFEVAITPDPTLETMFGCATSPNVAACREDGASQNILRSRDLVYRRPVPATVKLYPYKVPCGGETCEAAESWARGDEASGSLKLKLPQLSRDYTLSTGASIFRSRTVAAEFGPSGEPTMLQYDVGGGAKDLSSAIDASATAAQSLRDAKFGATQRRVDEIKTENELRELLDRQVESLSSGS